MWKLLVPFYRFINKSRFQLYTKHYTSSSYLGLPEIDIDYYLDEDNFSEIANNVKCRKSRADINNIFLLSRKLKEQLVNRGSTDKSVQDLREQFCSEIYKLPNKTHSDVSNYPENEPKIVRVCGEQKNFTFEPKRFADLTEKSGMIRTLHLGNLTGHRSYYLKGHLADLEEALIRFTIQRLLKHGFVLVSVPDLIIPEVIESCGMATTGTRTQVFKTASPWKDEFCLVGTAEMSLAGLYSKQTFERSQLPHRVCAASRCYRAETSDIKEENYSIFRVREFSKVEMFGMTCNETGQESEMMLSEFLSIQEELFSELGLCYQVLDMPPNELGSSAYRKYDIEAWMPGRKLHGEISSTSNCTDYQSKRLHIKYKCPGSDPKNVHTINGTACAVPRMLIALFENFQNEDGSVTLPEALRPFMNRKEVIPVVREPKMTRTKF